MEKKISQYWRAFSGMQRRKNILLCCLIGLLAGFNPATSHATNHQIRMDTIMAGLNGDPSIQFIQIVVNGNTQKDWGPQGSETQSRAMLVFFDAAGTQIGEFKFPHDPPDGANTVLIATAGFTNLTGLRADIVMPPLINPGSGKVCFKRNPANPLSFAVNLCLSYGTFPSNLTEGAGTPAPALLITGDPKALVRFQNFSFGDTTSRNADFRIGFPSPTNTSNQRFNFSVPGPKIQVSRLVDFGSQNVASGPTASTALNISNAGFSNALSITGVTLMGANANQFRILTDSGQAVLGPAASRLLTMDFDPSSLGSKTAFLRILSSDTEEPVVDVELRGNGSDLDPCAVPNVTNAIAQDVVSAAQFVGTGIVYKGTTVGATIDGVATCGNTTNSPDVWYKYIASATGTLTVNRSASPVPNAFSAYNGIPAGTNNQIICSAGPLASFPVTNGVELFFRIASLNNTTGAFEMVLTGPPAFNFDQNTNGINDNCELDFGDAPAPYPTLLANNGARHLLRPGFFLGTKIDVEMNGIPSALANGDNLNNTANDDDGVTFTTALRAGQTATASVIASTNGILNGWLDFNADGDWSDAGEQIFINRSLVRGTNILSFLVPSTATPTNRTFARFRFASVGGLTVTNLAINGEVEDYLVEILAATNAISPVGVRINEVMAGFNGDSTIQFVELEVNNATNKLWGPQGGETVGRAMLVFSDAAGEQVGRFVFPSNAPSGTAGPGNIVLIATREFAAFTGLKPDFIMPPEVMPVSGKVSFRNNPDNSQFNINISLAYGGNGYFGQTDGAGSANTNRLPILGASSLRRSQEFGFGLNLNAGFILSVPTPMNTAGQTFFFPPPASLAQQGKTLFNKETFRGNGRTCASCHVDGKDQFGLTPATIAALHHDDPLFVFEENINKIKLTGRSQPSDLRGLLTSGTNSTKIIGGSGDTYLVLGGENLSGTLSDTNGNSGTFQSFTAGNLNGPTPSNGSTRGLEDHELLAHGRGLILENIDGFNKPEVFRASPHLLNLAFTAPYGLSGEFDNLRDFSEGAVIQHFPRSLARISGLDFRHPTPEELQAMEAFQNTIGNPPGANTNRFNLDRLATTEAQKRGRELFFSDQSKCFMCHSGPTLSQSDGSLPGSIAGRNENFNTGIANLPVNLAGGHDLPTEPAGLTPGQSTRKFNTPPLFGIKLTAPYFHDNSAANLTEAIEFYDSIEFVASPDGMNVGAVIAANDPPKVADLVAFLESLVELPVDFTRQLSFGGFCAGEPAQVLSASITNSSTNTLVITDIIIAGTNASEFQVIGSAQTNLAPGATLSINIAFQPQSLGFKNATLEIAANDTDMLGSFSFGVALDGAFVDNVVEVSPLALNFGTRNIDDTSPTDGTPLQQAVAIVHEGTLDLKIVNISFVGNDAPHFQFNANSTPEIIDVGVTGFVEVVFAPQTQGAKSAMLRIETLACSNSIVEVALIGTGTSTLDHFAWDNIPSPQSRDVPFPVTVTAQDRNGDTMADFVGTVDLLATVVMPLPNSVLISEIDPGTPDAIEFVNVSTQPVNLLNWRVTIFDEINFPNPLTTFTITVNSNLPPGGRFTLTENGTAPGTFPNFFLGSDIFWTGASTSVAVLLRNAQSNIVDFVTTGSSLSIITPLAIPIAHWQGAGISAEAEDSVTSYQRIGTKDENASLDWVIAARNIGADNTGLLLPFPTNRVVPFSPGSSGNFISGVWSGSLTVFEEIAGVKLSANDGSGHSGSSSLFNVIGTLPTVSGLADLTIDEDTSTDTIPFTVADAEVAAETLIVTASSSNTNLVPNANIILGGTNENRTIRMVPATNQFGATTITVSVRDAVSTNSASFVLTVNPVNDGPVLAAIANRTVNEQVLLTLTAAATDADGTNDVLTFSLATAPEGAAIVPSTGVFSWTPTEAQGPGTNLVSIVVSDSGTPSWSATQSFSVTVLEVNSAPLLAAISNRTIYAENPFAFTNFATDGDIPTNTLTYSLLTPPTGASINSTNGIFTWTPSASQSPTTNLVRIRVADNGVPSLAVTQSFNLTVVGVPVGFVRTLDFGAHCSANFTNTLSVTFTNTASNTLTIASALLKGTNASEFQIISDTGETNLAPGETRQIEIGFAPQTVGNKQAVLEIAASENGIAEGFIFDVALIGSLSDSELQVSSSTLNFGTTSIDALTFTTNTFIITNNGSANLRILNIDLIGVDPTDPFNFQITSDTAQTNLLPGATRTLKIAFKPTRRGEKFAILEINSLACEGAFQEIFLAGTASSVLDHFAWTVASSNQAVNIPFSAQLIARDRNGDTLENFSGTATLSGSTGSGPTNVVLISEIDPGNPDAVEFINVSAAPVDVSGWRIVIYDPSPTVRSTTIIPSNSIVAPGGIFRITESGVAPGTFPNLLTGLTIGWVGSATTVSVLLQNAQGTIVDFATLTSSTSINNPVTIPTNHWNGQPIAAGATDGQTSYQRRGTNDNNSSADWSNGLLSMGALNIGLTVPFPGAPRSVLITPENPITFLNGVWNGSITVLEEVSEMRLVASDGDGRTGSSSPINVIGEPPTISTIVDIFSDEDTAIPPVNFVVGDKETAAGNLLVTANSSNTNLVPLAGLVLGGSNSNRTLAIFPATNQFGATTITLTVNDGIQANSNTFLVTINPVNDAPLLAGFSTNLVGNEDVVITSNFTISDVETPVNQLTLSATTLNPTLIPQENITFSGTNSSRAMIIRPATNQFGTATILVGLSDGETNVIRSVLVTINPVNDAPVFVPVGDRIVNEQTLLAITNVVTDVETNAVTFSFVTTPLPVMTLSSNGVFTWTPSEIQGPGLYTISLRATDNGSPNMSATQTFNVLVREVNVAPELSTVSGKIVHVGELLKFTNSATDSDFPANFLTFSLLSPPGNATIHPGSGEFTWTPVASDVGTNVITMRVTDSGVPSLSDDKDVLVEVVSAPSIFSAEISGDIFTIAWEAIVGKTYRVQFKFALEDANWTDLDDVTADSSIGMKTDTMSIESQRFYRVILVP